MTNTTGLTAIYNVISSINLSVTDLAKLTGTIIASDLSKPFIIPSITVPSSFQNIALFSTPLSSSIRKSDIKYYLSTSSNFLGGNTPSLSDKSFQKINTFRKDMQFGVNYKWNYGQKHSSCILFEESTLTYMFGCGVNLETFIPISIKSTGDTLLSGDFNIKDINDNSGFFVKKFDISNNTDSNLMYISNAGRLSVKSICLTGDTPPSSINDDGTLTINLGTSMFGSQTVDLTKNVTNIVYAYNSGLENGTYTIKINLNSYTIAYANSSNIFNATMNTNNSAAVLLVKVNTFIKNGNIMQYFTNMTYYAA